MTQEEVAKKVGVKANYIGYLERGMRHPSNKVLSKLADILDLNKEEVYFLANPSVRNFLGKQAVAPQVSAWQAFVRDKGLRHRYRITPQEMKVLSQISTLGQVRSARDMLFVLQVIRQAVREV
jgi:transcriptional regulator with XRE-family HTH domain